MTVSNHNFNRIEQLVVSALCAHSISLKQNPVPMSLREIEAATGLSHVSVIKVTKELRKRRMICVEKRRHPNRSNLYSVVEGLNSSGTKVNFWRDSSLLPVSINQNQDERRVESFNKWMTDGLNDLHITKAQQFYKHLLGQNIIEKYYFEHIWRLD